MPELIFINFGMPINKELRINSIMRLLKLLILLALFILSFLNVKSEQEKFVQYSIPSNDVSIAKTDSCENDSVRDAQ